MAVEDQPETSFQILQVSHTDAFAHQPGDAVAPLVIETLHDAGLAAAFVAGSMLPGGEPLGIGFIKVAVDQLAPITRRQRPPQALQTFGAAVADVKANDLARQT